MKWQAWDPISLCLLAILIRLNYLLYCMAGIQRGGSANRQRAPLPSHPPSMNSLFSHFQECSKRQRLTPVRFHLEIWFLAFLRTKKQFSFSCCWSPVTQEGHVLHRLASSELKQRRFWGLERCRSTGSGLFPYLDGGFAEMFGHTVDISSL